MVELAGLSAFTLLSQGVHKLTNMMMITYMGGKLEQVIPRARYPEDAVELKRIEDMGVKFFQNAKLMLINLLKLKMMQMLLL